MEAIVIINGLLPIISNAVALIQKIRETARQNSELTPEQDAELDARLEVIFRKAHWKREP